MYAIVRQLAEVSFGGVKLRQSSLAARIVTCSGTSSRCSAPFPKLHMLSPKAFSGNWGIGVPNGCDSADPPCLSLKMWWLVAF